MNIETLANIRSSYQFPELSSYLQDKPVSSVFKGLSGSSDAFLISNLYIYTEQTIVVFVENNKRAELLTEECRSLTNEESVMLFSTRDAVPYNLKSPFGPTVESRFNVLNQLLNGKKKIIINPIVNQKTS